MDRAAIGLGAVFMHLSAEVNWHRLFMDLIADFDLETLRARQAAALQRQALQLPTRWHTAWSPEVYGRHAAPRLRPALDLLGTSPARRTRTRWSISVAAAGALFPALRARFPRLGSSASTAPPRCSSAHAASIPMSPSWSRPMPLSGGRGSGRPDRRQCFALQLVAGHERLIPDLLGCCRVPCGPGAGQFRRRRRIGCVRETMAQALGRISWPEYSSATAYLRGSLRRPVCATRGHEPDLWRTTYFIAWPARHQCWTGCGELPCCRSKRRSAAPEPSHAGVRGALGERLPPPTRRTAGYGAVSVHRLFFVAQVPVAGTATGLA